VRRISHLKASLPLVSDVVSKIIGKNLGKRLVSSGLDPASSERSGNPWKV
jgi:hypothetical protein